MSHSMHETPSVYSPMHAPSHPACVSGRAERDGYTTMRTSITATTKRASTFIWLYDCVLVETHRGMPSACTLYALCQDTKIQQQIFKALPTCTVHVLSFHTVFPAYSIMASQASRRYRMQCRYTIRPENITQI